MKNRVRVLCIAVALLAVMACLAACTTSSTSNTSHASSASGASASATSANNSTSTGNASSSASNQSGSSSRNTLEAKDTSTLELVDANTRKIVCWGDSMTYGFGSGVAFIKTDDGIYDASFQSYPRVLQHFTGLPTLNFGFPGATSDMIVYMYTGLGELDYSYLIRPMNNDLLQYSIPGENDVLIIEMGSNGGWDDDYETLIDQYLTMLEFTNCEQYLILGDTDDPGTSFADTWQDPLPYGATDEETMWEEALHEAFGEHFVNLRLYLVEHGLEVAGLEATPEDEEAAQTGCVSEQLRFDETHMNGYGYYVWAKAIYEHGIELGYWE